jgi:leucyl/phenylalanyl-tRNA--protein transferase
LNHSKNIIPYLTGQADFPLVENTNKDGLLAIGGDLSTERLVSAYSQGIFPWFNDDALILWWSPDLRMVLFPGNLKISKSMRRVINSGRFRFSRNQAFDSVLERCASLPRKGQPGTWITPGMQKAYSELHRLGIAKSCETWEGDELVGGLYGVDMGHVFCAESMFHTVSNASKYAFISLVKDLETEGYEVIDCQVYSPHLQTLGAEEIPRGQFLEILKKNIQTATKMPPKQN